MAIKLKAARVRIPNPKRISFQVARPKAGRKPRVSTRRVSPKTSMGIGKYKASARRIGSAKLRKPKIPSWTGLASKARSQRVFLKQPKFGG